MKRGKVLKIYNHYPENKIRLLVFPFAGAGASLFREWEDCLSKQVELCALQLPGREDRYYEKPYLRIEDAMGELWSAFRDLPELPFAVFGHSMGALFCYEFTRVLAEASRPLPAAVFLSGANPSGGNLVGKNFQQMSEEELVAQLRLFNAVPPDILNNPDLIRIFLPAIQADLSLLENYHHRYEYRFSMPVTVFGGESDPIVPPGDLARWNQFAGSYCRIVMFPGDHFFLFPHRERILAEINNDLRFLACGK